MNCSKNKIVNNRTAAFTLVELLLVIAIIGVLSSLALVVVKGAQDEARRSATVARIGQIRAMFLDRLEGYEYRKIPVRLSKFTVGEGLEGRAEFRRVANRILADMINVEMPRGTVIVGPQPKFGQYLFPSSSLEAWLQDSRVLGNRPMVPPGSLTAAESLINALGNQRSIIVDQIEQNSTNFDIGGSEGLWFVLSTTDVDGTSGVDALGNNAFIDFDDDGLMSVVDSWNDPIGFQFYVINEATGDLYRDPDDNPPPGEPNRPLKLNELIKFETLDDGSPDGIPVRIEIHNIVVEFETNNPL